MDKLAGVFGEAILAPVRWLSNAKLKYYIFRQYNPNTKIPIEVQVCQALEQQKLISVAYPNEENRVWTDICQILFCQAFLAKGNPKFLQDGNDPYEWHLDPWEIRNPSAIQICWHALLSTYKVQDFFKKQWSFLTELPPPDVAARRRKFLLKRSLSNGLRSFNQGDQSADDMVRRRELLLRTLLSYGFRIYNLDKHSVDEARREVFRMTRMRLLSNDSKNVNQGNQSAKTIKYYSHYDNELELFLESLSPENLVIKESWSKFSPSDYDILRHCDQYIIERILADPNSNKPKIRKGILKKMLADPNSNIPHKLCKGNYKFRRYSVDCRTLYYRSYHMKKEEPYVIRAEATLKEETDVDNQHLSPIWHFKEPLLYYLELLQCIDESSLFMLLEDLLSDFARPREYYKENIKNADLNPWRWGMPDIVAYDKENNTHVLLECKGPKDRMKQTQIRWLSRNLERYNFNVGLVVVNVNQIGK